MKPSPRAHNLVWRLISDRKTDGKEDLPEFLAEVPISAHMDMTPPPDDPRGRWYSFCDYTEPAPYVPDPEPEPKGNRWREAVKKSSPKT